MSRFGGECHWCHLAAGAVDITGQILLVGLHKGKIVDVCEVPDHRTQLKALRTAFELAGALPAKGPARKRREHEGIQVIFAPPADDANKPLDPQPPPPEALPTEAPKVAPDPTPEQATLLRTANEERQIAECRPLFALNLSEPLEVL